MKLAIRVHRADAPDATKIGAYAFDRLLKLAQQTGRPLPAQPKPDVFFNLWVQGNLLLLGLWDGEQLCGIDIGLLTPSLLSGDVKILAHTGVWVDPVFRGNGGMRMLRTAMLDYARSRGAVYAIGQTDGLEAGMLAKLGYTYDQSSALKVI